MFYASMNQFMRPFQPSQVLFRITQWCHDIGKLNLALPFPHFGNRIIPSIFGYFFLISSRPTFRLRLFGESIYNLTFCNVNCDGLGVWRCWITGVFARIWWTRVRNDQRSEDLLVAFIDHDGSPTMAVVGNYLDKRIMNINSLERQCYKSF